MKEELQLLRQQAFINGEWTDALKGKQFSVRNPATGEIIAQVADLGITETKQAIAFAGQALVTWRATTAHERSAILKRWFKLIMLYQMPLAQLLSQEQGKPLNESLGEIAYGASFIEWFAEEGKRTYGETIPSPAPHRRLVTIKQPVGVVAAITPWNFPCAMITRKVGPALAAGCTLVLKPAAETPLTALALAVLAQEAGLPAGVLNIITSTDATGVGATLTASDTVRKLSFTGSTRVGKLLMAQSAETVKKLSLELGGNAPLIVFNDADLDSAVEGALAAKFRNSGQTCVCANRILVQDGIYDAFAERFSAAVAALKVGPATDHESQQGPLISSAACRKVEEHIADALRQGASLLTGGKPHALGGQFWQPTVLINVTSTMRIAHEETFGPVAPLFRFHDEQEAIEMANDSESGLAAYFWTQNIQRAWRVAEALESGMVGINEGLISNEVVPFGGIKQSGLGREGSRYGIEDYLEVKYLCFGGINQTGV
ncbi:succinate-semialdehyde dehydrogenase (NADP(+)) [Mixta theicola]|uniref:Succinate-semialdehyde dehydrogenase (NADP(+)) n=1 Tax=Mixta theicola TaxID=1458355 RepID=A0A2K1QDI0_9GAMM|nr:NAD-dependent succinate-semialdehyde dehydrogenase [Mixta theicola]PNS13089.1 succinate-semialdehyde dehydrogenase (NADP(+)) [Mixta theicola]GLR09355.1 NAD-dependent succinate-semialdehyde dehydrogenase [Mixta theicola]